MITMLSKIPTFTVWYGMDFTFINHVQDVPYRKGVNNINCIELYYKWL